MTESATFLASIAALQSAIMVGDDGMRVKLDVPESELGNALDILAWRGRVLRVTIEPQTKEVVGEGKPPVRRKAKRRISEGDSGMQ